MEKKIFSVPNISCGHCVMSIKNELSEMEGHIQSGGKPPRQNRDRGMGRAGQP